jgi:hypothetical protein
MGKTTQRTRVLQYMKEFGSITRNDAAIHIGCHELSSRIGELEKEGWEFNRKREAGTNRYGDATHWTRYSIKEQP